MKLSSEEEHFLFNLLSSAYHLRLIPVSDQHRRGIEGKHFLGSH